MKKFKALIFFLFCSLTCLAQWSNEMDSLAKATEKEFSLPHGICRAFALQESNYNQYAIRAEGDYLEADGRYAENIRRDAAKFSRAHGYQPSILTEIVQRSTSWTVFQIMGQNLRDMGFEVPFFASDLVLPDQFKYFGIFIKGLIMEYGGNVAFAASAYNGGRRAVRNGNYTNKKYVQNILDNLKSFSY